MNMTKEKYTKVKDHIGISRDNDTGAIVAQDIVAYKSRIAQKKLQNERDSQIKKLTQAIDSLTERVFYLEEKLSKYTL